MVVIFSFILSAYCVLMVVLLTGWIAVRRRNTAAVVGTLHQQPCSISIIVAMRNESSNLENLINDLSSMAYPSDRFEIIIIDDHSTDTSPTKAKELIEKVNNARLLILPEGVEGKKSAIQFGIDQSRFEIIATTDADCRLSKNWLHCLSVSIIPEEIKMVVGAVKLIRGNSFFSRLQVTEFISLVGTTASAIGLHHPVMCNGANLAFRKEVFNEVAGYNGNIQIASGDDEFLMRKIVDKYPSGVRFLNFYEGVVSTNAQQTLVDFFNQRLRWAGKWKHNSDWIARLLAVFIFLSQISFVGLILLSISDPRISTVGIVVLKLFLEGIFLFWVARFLERRFDGTAFIALQIFYPFYVVFIGSFSLVSSYRWKSRNYR